MRRKRREEEEELQIPTTNTVIPGIPFLLGLFLFEVLIRYGCLIAVVLFITCLGYYSLLLVGKEGKFVKKLTKSRKVDNVVLPEREGKDISFIELR